MQFIFHLFCILNLSVVMVGVVLVVKYTNIVVRTVDFVLLKRLVIPKVCQSYPYLAIGGLPDMCAVYIYSIN